MKIIKPNRDYYFISIYRASLVVWKQPAYYVKLHHKLQWNHNRDCAKAAMAHLHLKGQTQKGRALAHTLKEATLTSYKKWSVGYFELKLSIYALGTSETYFTSCKKGLNRSPLTIAGFSSTALAVFGGAIRGLMSDPATQQLSRSPPRIRKLPLHPYSLIRYWLSGASVLRNTGLPAIAKPLAMGRFL